MNFLRPLVARPGRGRLHRDHREPRPHRPDPRPAVHLRRPAPAVRGWQWQPGPGGRAHAVTEDGGSGGRSAVRARRTFFKVPKSLEPCKIHSAPPYVSRAARCRPGAGGPSRRRPSHAEVTELSRCSTPTTTCTRRPTRSPSTCRRSTQGVIKYVEVNGRTKIAIKNKISEYIPNPTFNKVAPPGAQELEFKLKNPDGDDRGRQGASSSRRRRSTSRRRRRVLRPRGPRQADGRAGHRPRDDVADARQPARGAPRRRPGRDRTWSSTRSTSGCTSSGPSTSRTGSSPRRSSRLPIVDEAIEELEWVVERGAKVILIRPAPVPTSTGRRSFALPEFDPFWQQVAGGRRRRRHARVRQRLPALHQRVGGLTTASSCRSTTRLPGFAACVARRTTASISDA